MDILKEQILRTKELMGILNENWRDTSWEDDDGKITIGDITDYIGNDIRNISVSDLENKLGDNVSSVTQGEERIMKADLQYPIILVQKDGEFSYVLDGNHRLAKAIMTGEEYIKAKVLYLDDKNTPEEFKRLLGREEVINEQRTMTVNGIKVTREEYYDYILRNYMHIEAKPGTFGREYAYKESYIEDLTDEEKIQYCKLLSDEFLVTYDVFDTEPFEGDTTC